MEDEVKKIVKLLTPDAWMGWKYITCPKVKKDVSWITCLACQDPEKDRSCPMRHIRIDAYPRQYEIGRYHTSELKYPRAAYYERTVDYARPWERYYDLLYGKAFGWFLESRYAPHEGEVELEMSLVRDEEHIKILGHGDLMHKTWGVELKFYYSTIYVHRAGKPSDDHIFQIQAYWTMGKKFKPWLFNDIKKLKLIYYSKMKGKFPRRKEFDVDLVDITEELTTNAWMLHDALINHVPPAKNCPAWRCRFCSGKKKCEMNEG